LARSDWSSQAARVKALERVLSDDSASAYTVMEATKELRRITSRKRGRKPVQSGSLEDVNAKVREWWRVVVLPSLGVEPGVIELFEPDVEPLTFKPVTFYDNREWVRPDGEPLLDDVAGRVWRSTSPFQLWWVGHRLSGDGVFVDWSRVRLPRFESHVWPGWATGPDAFELGEPREPRVRSGVHVREGWDVVDGVPVPSDCSCGEICWSGGVD
jgi:hypothetical protein